MPRGRTSNLNESGEMLMTRIVRGAALHVSCGEQTLLHSHYAWKVHIGVDAPVWFESAPLVVPGNADAQVVIVPPGLDHRIGSLGLSVTILVAPGSRSTEWRAVGGPAAIEGTRARRLTDAARAWQAGTRADTNGLVSELLGLARVSSSNTSNVDPRVRHALARLSHQPDLNLAELAGERGLSLDRLSHVVVRDTGLPLRRHALWSRLMRLLSSNEQFSSVAAAAAAAGFSDHAHMTRTYRAMLGRLPSEFTGPPDTIEPWAS